EPAPDVFRGRIGVGGERRGERRRLEQVARVEGDVRRPVRGGDVDLRPRADPGLPGVVHADIVERPRDGEPPRGLGRLLARVVYLIVARGGRDADVGGRDVLRRAEERAEVVFEVRERVRRELESGEQVVE